jgi:hypothetical protein
MSKFTIKQEELARLKVFSDYLGKLKDIAPLSSLNIFYLDETNSKLGVYAIGAEGSTGAIQQEMLLDVSNIIIDNSVTPQEFVIGIEVILTAVQKIKSGDIDFSFDVGSLNISSSSTKYKFSTKLNAPHPEAELKEIRDFMSTQLALEEFDDTHKITLSLKDIKDNLINLSSLTKEFNLNKLISVDETSLRAADNFGIFLQNLTTKPITQEIYFHRDIANLIKGLDEIIISSDKKFWYLDFAAFGIKAIFVAPTAQFVYPTDDELEGFAPSDQSRLKLEVSAATLYSVLAEFDGLFDSQWTYDQIYLKTPVDFAINKELELSWDDKVHRVDTLLPVDIIERTDTSEDFEFIIPTRELKTLEPIFNKDSNSKVTIEYSSLPIGQNHGSGTKWYNSEASLFLPKMNI